MFRRDADVKQSPSNLTEMTQGISVGLGNSYRGQRPSTLSLRHEKHCCVGRWMVSEEQNCRNARLSISGNALHRERLL